MGLTQGRWGRYILLTMTRAILQKQKMYKKIIFEINNPYAKNYRLLSLCFFVYFRIFSLQQKLLFFEVY